MAADLTNDSMAKALKLDNRLGSTLSPDSPRAKANRDAMRALLASLRGEEDTIRQGGGTRQLKRSAPRPAHGARAAEAAAR